MAYDRTHPEAASAEPLSSFAEVLDGMAMVMNQSVHGSGPGSMRDPILDMTTFQGLQTFLEPAQLAEMYREFLRLTRNRIEALRRNPQAETVRNITHTIAGTAGMLGAQGLATLAQQLEADADGSFSFATDVDLLHEACDTLSHALRACKVKL
jgi:HPt (histidine-containing phosphotransfer) domain-containing protein